MAIFGQREDLYNVHAIITAEDGTKFKFTADSMTGGSVKPKETKYRAANGTERQQSLGGSQEVTNVSLKVLLTFAIYQQLPWILQQSGKAKLDINKQPLDIDGNPFGKALAYSGTLDEVMPPDSNSESDAAGVLTIAQSSVSVSSA